MRKIVIKFNKQLRADDVKSLKKIRSQFKQKKVLRMQKNYKRFYSLLF